MAIASDQPVVSIIIPCRNHAVALDRCLLSLDKQSFPRPFEVIVVDSSSDDAAVTVANRHSGVRIYWSQKRLMPGQARNLGASKATGRFLAFIDADCVAEPNWITALRSALDAGHRVVGGAVLQGYPWHPVSIIDNLMQFVDLHPMRPKGNASLLPSCNLAIAREDFAVINRFPELELPAGEDVLFCANARSRWPEGLYFEPAMKVRHFGRTGLRDFWCHQDLFGFCRGAYALELQPRHRSMGRLAIFAPVVGLRRLSSLLSRAAGHPASFVRMLLLLPLLLVGLAAWCIGFRRGCLESNPIDRIS